MARRTESLRGYSLMVHERDEWRCVYSGLDGRDSLQNWLSLSRDHLLPKSDPRHKDDEFIVTCCLFCNGADNKYFGQAEARGLVFAGLERTALIEQRKPWVARTREQYQTFWQQRVARAPQGAAAEEAVTVRESVARRRVDA